MKITFVVILLIVSINVLSDTSTQSMCEEGLQSYLKSCEIGYQKCTASMPNQIETCDAIYFDCTQRANDWYNGCTTLNAGN